MGEQKRVRRDLDGMVASRIRRHINGLPRKTIFVTRDVIYCGKRSAVDNVLFRLVRDGDLVRLARGVFVSSRGLSELPSVLDIVKAKAAAFNRAIFVSAREAAVNLGLLPDGHAQAVFATDGGHTSFYLCAHEKRVELKNVCPRKRDVNDSPVVQALRAVWLVHKKDRSVPETGRRLLIKGLGREGWDQFLTSSRRMPTWLWNDLEKAARAVLVRYGRSSTQDTPRVQESWWMNYGWKSLDLGVQQSSLLTAGLRH